MLNLSTPLRVRPACELNPCDVTWPWQYWLAAGKPTLLDGDPGLGKSLITLDLCARLSTGRPMPDGSPGPGRPVNCLVLNAEDGVEDTIHLRLRALGADENRVIVVERDELDWAEPIRLPSQLGALETVIAAMKPGGKPARQVAGQGRLAARIRFIHPPPPMVERNARVKPM
jgi:hypothetical protein